LGAHIQTIRGRAGRCHGSRPSAISGRLPQRRGLGSKPSAPKSDAVRVTPACQLRYSPTNRMIRKCPNRMFFAKEARVSPRKRRSSSAPAGSSSIKKCPECGRSFTRAQAMGAHRRQAHGIAGTSARTRARRQTNGRGANGGANGKNPTRRTSTGVDHDRLLETVFPQGIPARQDVIGALNSWLAEADRLARIRG
jgi:hypothetical protein